MSAVENVSPTEEPVAEVIRTGSGRNLVNLMPYEVRIEIISYLESDDLSRLGSTCQNWDEFVTPILYHRDAKEDNQAILWATLTHLPFTPQVNNVVLRRSIRYGGNVNATRESIGGNASALHFAAGRNRPDLVRILLNNGTRVEPLSSGADYLGSVGVCDNRPDQDVNMYPEAIVAEFRVSPWTPLLLPFIRSQPEIVELMHQAGASAYLTRCVGWDGVQMNVGVTTYHTFATMDDRQFHTGPMKQVNRLVFNRNLPRIDILTPRHGLTPLHMALDFANEFMIGKFLRAGAGLEVRSLLGRSALHHAVHRWSITTDRPQRKILMGAIKQIIDMGADVNSKNYEETALICAAESNVDERWEVKDMRTIMDWLLNKRAKVNDMTERGMTAVHHLAQVIIDRGGSTALEALLGHLVLRGGDINLPNHMNDHTILFDFLAAMDHMSGRSVDTLIKMGAHIQPYEADALLHVWLRGRRIRTAARGYDVFKHKDDISRPAVEDAYRYVFQTQDKYVHSTLMSLWPKPSIGSELVAVAVQTPNHNLWADVERHEINPNYVSRQGLSYIHMIVNKLDTPHYSEKLAVKDALYFIKKGASVLHRDRDGMTASQRLRRFCNDSQAYTHLRLLLSETKDRELGEW